MHALPPCYYLSRLCSLIAGYNSTSPGTNIVQFLTQPEMKFHVVGWLKWGEEKTILIFFYIFDVQFTISCIYSIKQIKNITHHVKFYMAMQMQPPLIKMQITACYSRVVKLSQNQIEINWKYSILANHYVAKGPNEPIRKENLNKQLN